MGIPARLKSLAVVAAVAVAIGAAATAFQPAATALPQAATDAPAPTLTLPDFSVLVERNGDTVVNVTAEGKRGRVEAPPGEGSPFPFPFPVPPGARPFGGEPPVQRGMGSGFIISTDGYIVTNHHVVADAEQIKVKLSDKREYQAKLIGSDRQSDVALLKVDAENLPVAQVGNSDQLKVGQWVFAIGAPFGLDRTATQGIVSALGRSLPNENYVPFIQTDVAVNPGNSGGPLFDTAGRVVGINSQIYSRSGGYMGLSFAIPVNVAMDVVQQLKDHGKVERGWLGIQLQEVTQDLARSFGLDRPHGALVAGVTPGSPADKAGNKTGDVIVAYAGTPVEDSSDLPPLVGATRPGQARAFTIMRGGKQRQLDVTLGKLEERDVKIAANGDATPEGTTLNLVVSDLNAAQLREGGVDNGVLVRRVGPGIAADAGVRPGDILVQVDGKPVENAEQLRKLARDLPAGKSVAVLVKRGEFAMFLAMRVPEDNRG